MNEHHTSEIEVRRRSEASKQAKGESDRYVLGLRNSRRKADRQQQR